MSRSIRVCVLLLAYLVAACGEFIVDDKDFSDNRRNVDITLDNSEELLWSAYQATVQAFRFAELYRGIDGYEMISSEKIGAFDCPLGGRIEFDYPHLPKESYKAGDAFSLDYIGCVRSDGYELSGMINGRYKEVDGYNDSFDTNYTVGECATDIGGQLVNPLYIFSSSDSLILEKKANQLFIRYRDKDPANADQLIVVDDFVLDQGRDAVVVNRSKADPTSVLPEDGVAVYKVSNLESELVDCLYAERVVALEVSNFSVEGSEVSYVISGAFDLNSWLRRQNNIDYELIASGVRVDVAMGNYAESYTLNELVWGIELDSVTNLSYSIESRAELVDHNSSDIFEMVTFIPFRGALNSEIPPSGRWRALGRSDESAAADILSSTALQFNASLEGDVDGDGREDFGTFFSSAWTDFLSRNFLRPASD